MRLCWNDWFGGPLRDLKRGDAQALYDMGWRVAGINSGDRNATDDDISRVRDIFGEVGLFPGPFGAGVSIFNVDPEKRRENKAEMINALRIAGKLGCTGVRYSVGSMHPTDVWRHHPDNHTQKALDMIIEATKELVPYAEDAGCMLCPETNAWTIVNNPPRMKEYVDRLDSPYAKIIFDPVNQMSPERAFESGKYIRCAVAMLGDRIGEFHVKDHQVMDNYMIHIEETRMGTGFLDHEAFMKASGQLEPWKTFSLEHIRDRSLVKPAYDYIQSVAERIGHTWTAPQCTREKWEQGNCSR